jgi:hypothetical protein
MEPEGSLPYSQESATGPNPELDEFSLHIVFFFFFTLSLFGPSLPLHCPYPHSMKSQRVVRRAHSPCGQQFLTDAVATLSLGWSQSAAGRYVGRGSRLSAVRINARFIIQADSSFIRN